MEPSRTALPPAPDGVAPRDRLLLPLAVLLSVAVHLAALVLSPFGAVPGKGVPLEPAGFAARS